MGVPGFVKWISKKKKLSKAFISTITKKVHTLYLDSNCLFHPQCFKVLEKIDETDHKKLEALMIKRILAYIDFLIEEVEPTKRVFISVDGVPPVAKMNQQRKRRFMGVENKEFENNLKKEYGKKTSTWSNVVITPGTDFMERLHCALVKYIKSKKDGLEYIYSSYHHPGEGEHKILEHIRERRHLKDVFVIYGLDADLISLAIASQKNNIYLLREVQHYGKFAKFVEDTPIQIKDEDDVSEETNLMDIDVLKTKFGEYLFESINEKDPDIKYSPKLTTRLINDFIVLIVLLGNDFLPHFPSIHINQDGLDELLNSYEIAFLDLKGSHDYKFLIDYNPKKNKIFINQPFLTYLLNEIADKENIFITEKLPRFKSRRTRMKCYSRDEYDIKKWKHDMAIGCQVEDTIELGTGEQEEWKFKYYNKFFNCNEFYEETVKTASYNYLKGFVWVTKYYFEGCPGYSWQYQHTHTPFISDMADYLSSSKININNIKFAEKEILTPCQQLLAVIPPQYSHLLPKNYQKLMFDDESPLMLYYPRTYDIDMINRFILHEAVPMIPNVETDRIIKATKTIPLTKTEIIRNKTDVLIYN